MVSGDNIEFKNNNPVKHNAKNHMGNHSWINRVCLTNLPHHVRWWGKINSELKKFEGICQIWRLKMVTKNLFMPKIDLKYAYYKVSISRKF